MREKWVRLGAVCFCVLRQRCPVCLPAWCQCETLLGVLSYSPVA